MAFCYHAYMDIDHNKITEFAKKYGLSLVVLFGSHATGHTHKGSDVDIAFLPVQPLTTPQEIQINYELTLICKTDRIDSVNLRYAHPLLLKEIADQGKILYENTGTEFAELEIYALRRYQEARLLYEIRREKLAEFVGS
jgi:uncharacterized protein